MKEYRLIAWAELPASFDRTAYRRMLTDLSHRYMSEAKLAAGSGIRRHEVRQFLEGLDARGLLASRDLFAPDSMFGPLRPFGGWLRKALNASVGNH